MKNSKYVPIVLIFTILLIGRIQMSYISIVPTTINYVSYAVFVIILIFYFINVKLGLYATGIMILLGIFNLVPIFLGKFNISFFVLGSDNERIDSIKIDLRCIGLMVVFLICTWKSIVRTPVKQDHGKKS